MFMWEPKFQRIKFDTYFRATFSGKPTPKLRDDGVFGMSDRALAV
jgi:hypothetical protein